MDRTVFFDMVRQSLFHGSLTQPQVDGLNCLLDYAEARTPALDPRHTAYILATAYHETAMTMQPIAEYGQGAGKSYGEVDPETGQCYYGRGFVQLTWKENYATQEAKCGLPLVTQPDLAMEHQPAAQILYEGMLAGDFTGVGVSTYIHDSACDYYNARRVVNGTDCADQIARYAENFADALGAAWRATAQTSGSQA